MFMFMYPRCTWVPETSGPCRSAIQLAKGAGECADSFMSRPPHLGHVFEAPVYGIAWHGKSSGRAGLIKGNHQDVQASKKTVDDNGVWFSYPDQYLQMNK